MPASPILTTCGQGVTSSVQGRDPKFQGVAEQRWRGGDPQLQGASSSTGGGVPNAPSPGGPASF